MIASNRLWHNRIKYLTKPIKSDFANLLGVNLKHANLECDFASCIIYSKRSD